MVSVGILLQVGNFELDLTSYLFYKFTKAPHGRRRYAGAHASVRAGQHFDKLRCSCPIWHSLNFEVKSRV